MNKQTKFIRSRISSQLKKRHKNQMYKKLRPKFQKNWSRMNFFSNQVNLGKRLSKLCKHGINNLYFFANNIYGCCDMFL